MFKDGHFKWFYQFVEDFNIPGAQFSRFLRIRHAVLCELKKDIEMQMSQIEKLLYKETVSLNWFQGYIGHCQYPETKANWKLKRKKERGLGKELNILTIETDNLIKQISMKRHQVVLFNYILFREHIYVLFQKYIKRLLLYCNNSKTLHGGNIYIYLGILWRSNIFRYIFLEVLLCKMRSLSVFRLNYSDLLITPVG